jgi:flagellar assembly protein FliH
LVLDPNELLTQLGKANAALQDVVARAKQQVEIIIRTAQADAKALLDQAYADGYKAGVEQATRRADGLFERLEDAIAQERAEREELVKTVEEQVLMLCVAAAEKKLRHEIRTDPEIVARLIRLCLRRVRDRDEVTVRVSPQEVEHIKAMREELLSTVEGIRGFNVVDDRRVSAGGCIVESPSGDLDARIEIQIDQLRRKLMDTFEHEFSKPASGPDQVSRGDQQDGHDTG